MNVVAQPEKHWWGIRTRLKVSIIAVAIGLVVILTLTYYAELIPVDHNSVVSQDAAFSSIPYYTNGTYQFASGNTRWIMIVQTRVWTPASTEFATLYIFKTAAGDGGKDLRILGIDTVYNGTIREGANRIIGIVPYENRTLVSVQYFLDAAGTYVIDFGLQVQVYSTFLSLPIAQEEIRVATNTLAHYG